VARYLKTGKSNFIGKQNTVTAKTAKGREIQIMLCVTEVKDPDTGEALFTGVFFPA